MLRNKEKLFHFWFNTFFVDELAKGETISCQRVILTEIFSPMTELPDGNLSYKLKKHELDDAHKDKLHKTYAEDFEVSVT